MTNVTTIQPLQIEVDGLPLAASADKALREIRIRQCLSESSQCTLTFVEPEDGDFINSCRLMPGTRLQVSALDQQSAFSGTITGFEYRYGAAGERVVTISAHDDLYVLTQRQPVKAHVQLTVPELAESMLTDIGISVAAEASGPVWDHIVQHRASDLEFLRDYAERSGLYFLLRDGILHFYGLQPAIPAVALEYRQSLLEVTLKNNPDWNLESVTVKGWNPWRARAQAGQAQAGHTEGGCTSSRIVSDQPAQTDAQLDTLAAAELDRAGAHRQSVSGTAEGDFRLSPGASVQIEGVDAALCGLYRLTTVEHRINAEQGFVSVFDTTPPKRVPRSQAAMATMACVTQVEDPERLGRVKVLLHGYNEVESDWLAVAMPAAGANKGLIVLPDIDDKVLVLLLNGRPDQAIVIGGLFGEQRPPDQNVENNAVHRYSLLTPGGQAIRMNDLDDTITIENSSGSRIELNGDAIKLETSGGQALEMDEHSLRLHAQTDCYIEAPGRTLTLKADKINFERG